MNTTDNADRDIVSRGINELQQQYLKLDYDDDFTSYDENMILINCERMVDISSEIEIVNDWVGKDEIIELLKLQIEQLKGEIVYMKNEMDEKNFQIRSLLIQESKDLANVYDWNENNNNSTDNSSNSSDTTTSTSSTHLSSTHLSSTTSIIEPIDGLQTTQPANTANKLNKQLENIRSEKKAYYEYVKINERNIELVNGGNERKTMTKHDFQPHNINMNNETAWKDNTTLEDRENET